MNNGEILSPGDIVTSTAGRDRGRYYIVMALESGFVRICDGDLHKTDNMKKKNIKHIKASGKYCEYVKGKLLCGDKVTNAELRRSISEFEEKL